jgi:hypothetical protein
MKKILLTLLLLAPALGGFSAQSESAELHQKPSDAQHRFEALVKEYQSAQSDFSKAYSKAKTDAEREKIHYPSAENYAGRFLSLAREFPEDRAALEALVWIATNCRRGEEHETSLELLLKDHIRSTNLGRVAQSLIYSQNEKAEDWLRTVLEETPHHEVKGEAAYSLGRFLRSRAEYARQLQKEGERRNDLESWLGKSAVEKLARTSPDEIQIEAEKLFETVATKYSDVKAYRGSLADAAHGELYEIRSLAIGKVAPEIEGKDVERKKIKLSDYRGKVVVIDFWGDW